MSPGEVFQTATLNPALYFHLSDSLGTVSQNKIADMDILNDNLMENIENTKSLYRVIKGGKHLDRNKLDELLKNSKVNSN